MYTYISFKIGSVVRITPRGVPERRAKNGSQAEWRTSDIDKLITTILDGHDVTLSSAALEENVNN